MNHYNTYNCMLTNHFSSNYNPMMHNNENCLFSSCTMNEQTQNIINYSTDHITPTNDNECFHVFSKLTSSGQTIVFTFNSNVPENQESIPFDINYTKPSFGTHVPLVEYTFNPNNMVSINKSDKAIYGLCVKYGDLILKTVPIKFYSVETCYGKCGKKDELYKKLQHNFINICDFGGSQCPLTLCIEFDLSRHVDKNGKKHKKKTTVGYGVHTARISKNETYGVFKTICCTSNKFTIKIFRKKGCYCKYAHTSKYEFLLIRKELHNRTAKKSIMSEPAIIQWKSPTTTNNNIFIDETKHFGFPPTIEEHIDDNCSIQSSIPSSSSVSSSNTVFSQPSVHSGVSFIKRKYPYPPFTDTNNSSTRRRLNNNSVLEIDKYNVSGEDTMSTFMSFDDYNNNSFFDMNQMCDGNKYNFMEPSPEPPNYNFIPPPLDENYASDPFNTIPQLSVNGFSFQQKNF